MGYELAKKKKKKKMSGEGEGKDKKCNWFCGGAVAALPFCGKDLC